MTDPIEVFFENSISVVNIKGYGCKANYVPPQPQINLGPAVSLTMTIPKDHPFLSFVDQVENLFDNVNRQTSIDDGGPLYQPQYTITAVLPEFCTDPSRFSIFATGNPDAPFELAYLLKYSEEFDDEFVSKVLCDITEWLDSGVFIQDTADYKRIKDELKVLVMVDVKSLTFEELVSHREKISEMGIRFHNYRIRRV
jgi:hypothetical protein